jgi:uncharacterized lipoprotein YajG
MKAKVSIAIFSSIAILSGCQSNPSAPASANNSVSTATNSQQDLKTEVAIGVEEVRAQTRWGLS